MNEGVKMGKRKAETAHDGARLFDTDKYSNFTVYCGDRAWKVHRAIICSRSSYFEAACDNEFKESNSRSMMLKDDDPALVEQMLLWLYTQVYPTGTVPRGKEALILDAKMYGLADKYNLGSLKDATKSCFRAMLNTNWDSDHFVAAATLIWQTTPDGDAGLRHLVVAHLWAHKGKLLARSDVKVLMKELDGFSRDLMLALAEDPSMADPTDIASSNRRFCKSCEKIVTAVKSGGSRTCPNAAQDKRMHVLMF